MKRRLAILTLFWMSILILFNICMIDIGWGQDHRIPAIGMPEVSRLVQAEFPNARILELELDYQHGQLVYEVELITADGQKKEVHVNASTGQIEKSHK